MITSGRIINNPESHLLFANIKVNGVYTRFIIANGSLPITPLNDETAIFEVDPDDQYCYYLPDDCVTKKPIFKDDMCKKLKCPNCPEDTEIYCTQESSTKGDCWVYFCKECDAEIFSEPIIYK
ncbi:MAG: hypothetical protein WC119_00865 [Synergistaceae bacterium]